MALQIEKLLKIFKTVTQEPSSTAAYIFHYAHDKVFLNLSWSQRSLDRGKFVKFVTNNIIDLKTSNVHTLPPVDVSSELLTAVSQSTNYRAVIREIVSEKNAGKKQQHLEIWKKSNLVSTMDLTALDVHGDVYCDSEFGTLEWSPCEEKLLYIAEKKVPKSEPFYKVTAQDSNISNENDVKKTSKGGEYIYRQDWGEALVGKHHPVIVVCNVITEKLQVLEGIPDDLSPGQVAWAPKGGVIGVGWYHNPRRIGLIYCTNRPSCIFHLDSCGIFRILSSMNKDVAVRSPRVSLDGDYVVWLERPANGPHHSCHYLVKHNWSTSTVIIEIVLECAKTLNGKEFYGIYCQSLPQRCFISSKELIFSSPQKFAIKSYIVNTETKSINELSFDKEEVGSSVVLDVLSEDLIVCAYSSLKLPAQIKLIKYSNGEVQNNVIVKSTSLNSYMEKMTIDYLSLQSQENDDCSDYGALFLGPSDEEQSKSVPLLVCPHGGPHSGFVDSYSCYWAFFAAMGFGVLLVNYRGSTGQGQNNVYFLPGRVGNTDVKDCHNAVSIVCQKYPYIDTDKIVLYGGSHGGFLVTHLSGQYPTTYKAVVSINPVIDIASMFFETDIPDWAVVEGGYSYGITSEADLIAEQLSKMREISPLHYSHQVKSPTLLLLGKKDLRVPMSQGLLYYHTLKALNVKTKILSYEDNHPLSQVPVEVDALINSALWFLEHINHNV